jgi:2',3'-cyclic-nucleotide 2'-phosphodiesterase (5'-nucleotidase family)
VKKQAGYVLQVDLGDYFMALGPGSDTVNKLMLDSLTSLPIGVMNLAPEDLFMWKELSAAKLPTKIISTNLTPRDSSVPTPARYAIVEVPGATLGLKKNLRLGFLGLSNPTQIKPNSGFNAADPLEAVAQVKPELLKKTDYLMVLADLPKVTAVRLAKENPEIYAILLLERTYVDTQPEQVNNAVLVWSVERGRQLGQLVMELDERGNIVTFKPNKVELNSTVPTDAALLKRENETKASVPATAGH